MNVFTRQFYEWEDVEYPSISRYYDFGRQRTMVADVNRGLCVLDVNENTLCGDAINLEFETGLVFPMQNPKMEVGFTQGWLLAKPTMKSVEVTIHYSLDGKEENETTVDLIGSGYGSVIADTLDAGGGLIGEGTIGRMDEEMAAIPFKIEGECSSVRFRLTHEPPEMDPDQEFEVYGIVCEYEYLEDKEIKETA
jgi:hypothetical protein